jgi:hypothetical protein
MDQKIENQFAKIEDTLDNIENRLQRLEWVFKEHIEEQEREDKLEKPS